MAQLIYQINSGYPNFTAHIEPNEADDQIHSSTGIYSFDVPEGEYSITVTDAIGCEAFFDNINIISSLGFGLLYPWEITQGQGQKSISSDDNWIVPSKEIFISLLDSMDTYDVDINGWPLAGGKLKETGFDHWDAPNEGATNEFGFNSTGVGNRGFEGVFGAGDTEIRKFAGYWSSSIDTNIENRAFSLAMDTYSTIASVVSNIAYYGFALRLCNPTTLLSEGTTGTYTQNDGAMLNTVVINGVEWLAENLRDMQLRDGTSIPNITDNTIWTTTPVAWCVYDNLIINI